MDHAQFIALKFLTSECIHTITNISKIIRNTKITKIMELRGRDIKFK